MTSKDIPEPGTALLLGGTGTIGRAVAAELLCRGYRVVCLLRPRAGGVPAEQAARLLPGAEICFGEASDPAALADAVFRHRHFDAAVSCMASRSGDPRDAWAVDYEAHLNILNLAREHGVGQMVLLSAICVQKPRLAFQHAKLAFEKALVESGLNYSIVRPTAYFKSLAGQIARVRQGKPFLIFGDGRLTACKPIGDADLACYIADCLRDVSRHRSILPIGGPGPAITPIDQGNALFELLARPPRFRQVPVSLLSGAAVLLGGLGMVLPQLVAKAELARIGHCYATESMLLLDPETGHYDDAATPETGRDTLFDYYRRVIAGRDTVERGEHAIFRDG